MQQAAPSDHPGQGAKEHIHRESEVMINSNHSPPSEGSPPTQPSSHGSIPSTQGSPHSTEMLTPLPVSNGTTYTDPERHIKSDNSDHTHLDSDDEELLEASTTKDEVAQLLRTTVEELEAALEVMKCCLSIRFLQTTCIIHI